MSVNHEHARLAHNWYGKNNNMHIPTGKEARHAIVDGHQFKHDITRIVWIVIFMLVIGVVLMINLMVWMRMPMPTMINPRAQTRRRSAAVLTIIMNIMVRRPFWIHPIKHIRCHIANINAVNMVSRANNDIDRNLNDNHGSKCQRNYRRLKHDEGSA